MTAARRVSSQTSQYAEDVRLRFLEASLYHVALPGLRKRLQQAGGK